MGGREESAGNVILIQGEFRRTSLPIDCKLSKSGHGSRLHIGKVGDGSRAVGGYGKVLGKDVPLRQGKAAGSPCRRIVAFDGKVHGRLFQIEQVSVRVGLEIGDDDPKILRDFLSQDGLLDSVLLVLNQAENLKAAVLAHIPHRRKIPLLTAVLLGPKDGAGGVATFRQGEGVLCLKVIDLDAPVGVVAAAVQVHQGQVSSVSRKGHGGKA